MDIAAIALIAVLLVAMACGLEITDRKSVV